MHADIPARRRFDIECKTLENIVHKVTLDKTKWLIYAIYRPPSMAKRLRAGMSARMKVAMPPP